MSADRNQEPAVTPAPSARRFSAFISYSHADERVAARLHRDIETYRLPKRLRDRDGADVAGGRLGAVFRDRADLAAADSLSDAIRAALADSGVLIVLCSPDAAQSRWVDAEIRLFREVNPGAPVLAAVVRGEPDAAMPAALTDNGREPLAADLREQGDGRKLGFLKIAAALAGVPLDALIQRDAQRRLRRVMAVTVAALIALLAMATMTALAISARNEAQVQRAEAVRQRSQANGLVDFMLTDLRERLRGVGRVDIMRAAASRALENYRQDDDGTQLPPDSAARLAQVLMAIGEDDANSGRLNEAERSFTEAHRTTAALLTAEPNNPARVFAHAQSEFWLSRGHYDRGNFSDAMPYARRYRQLAYRLRTLEPGTIRSVREVAYAEGAVCSVEQLRGNPDVDSCENAFHAQQDVRRRLPNDLSVLSDVSSRAGWLADALERRDGVRAGMPYRLEQLRIARRLVAAEPQNWDHRETLVGALYSVATANIRANQTAAATPVLREAQTNIAAMRRHDAANSRWADLQRLIEERL